AYAMLGQGNNAWELFSLLNPINRTSTRADVHRYKVEPYVIAADVYSSPPHVGRGGWTWYTGSAGWMYGAGLEGILGFRVRGASLLLTACTPCCTGPLTSVSKNLPVVLALPRPLSVRARQRRVCSLPHIASG